MASVSAPGGRSAGGRRSVNVELNLVPFIDLLTCLICFLLMTAVWQQIGKISIVQSGRSASTEAPSTPALSLVVAITPQGYLLTGNGTVIADILKKDADYDKRRLGQKLQELHGAFPDKRDIIVMSEDSIAYQELVDALDVCLANEFPDISVSSTI